MASVWKKVLTEGKIRVADEITKAQFIHLPPNSEVTDNSAEPSNILVTDSAGGVRWERYPDSQSLITVSGTTSGWRNGAYALGVDGNAWRISDSYYGLERVTTANALPSCVYNIGENDDAGGSHDGTYGMNAPVVRSMAGRVWISSNVSNLVPSLRFALWKGTLPDHGSTASSVQMTELFYRNFSGGSAPERHKVLHYENEDECCNMTLGQGLWIVMNAELQTSNLSSSIVYWTFTIQITEPCFAELPSIT